MTPKNPPNLLYYVLLVNRVLHRAHSRRSTPVVPFQFSILNSTPTFLIHPLYRVPSLLVHGKNLKPTKLYHESVYFFNSVFTFKSNWLHCESQTTRPKQNMGTKISLCRRSTEKISRRISCNTKSTFTDISELIDTSPTGNTPSGSLSTTPVPFHLGQSEIPWENYFLYPFMKCHYLHVQKLVYVQTTYGLYPCDSH